MLALIHSMHHLWTISPVIELGDVLPPGRRYSGSRGSHRDPLTLFVSLRPPSLDEEARTWPIKIYALGSFTVLKDEVPIGFSRKTQKPPLELLQALIAWAGTSSRSPP